MMKERDYTDDEEDVDDRPPQTKIARSTAECPESLMKTGKTPEFLQVRNPLKRKRRRSGYYYSSEIDSSSSYSSSSTDDMYKKKKKKKKRSISIRGMHRRVDKTDMRPQDRRRHHDKNSRSKARRTSGRSFTTQFISDNENGKPRHSSMLSGWNQSPVLKETGDDDLVQKKIVVTKKGTRLMRRFSYGPSTVIERSGSLSPLGSADMRRDAISPSASRRSRSESPPRSNRDIIRPEPKIRSFPYVPFGYYFRPTDRDLITYFLELKIADPQFNTKDIAEVQSMYAFHPQQLGKDSDGRYYFVEIAQSSKVDREVKGYGKWIVQGKAPVWAGEIKCGYKRPFTFKDSNPINNGITWLMKELSSIKSSDSDPKKWVIYHVYQKLAGENATPKKRKGKITVDEGPSGVRKNRKIYLSDEDDDEREDELSENFGAEGGGGSSNVRFCMPRHDGRRGR